MLISIYVFFLENEHNATSDYSLATQTNCLTENQSSSYIEAKHQSIVDCIYSYIFNEDCQFNSVIEMVQSVLFFMSDNKLKLRLLDHTSYIIKRLIKKLKELKENIQKLKIERYDAKSEGKFLPDSDTISGIFIDLLRSYFAGKLKIDLLLEQMQSVVLSVPHKLIRLNLRNGFFILLCKIVFRFTPCTKLLQELRKKAKISYLNELKENSNVGYSTRSKICNNFDCVSNVNPCCKNVITQKKNCNNKYEKNL